MCDLNPVGYSVCCVLQEVYKTRITDLDDLKHRIRTEWANLDHAVIAADVRQWRRRLSACVRAAAVISNTAFNSDVVFYDNCRCPLKPSLSTGSRVEQLQADIPI